MRLNLNKIQFGLITLDNPQPRVNIFLPKWDAPDGLSSERDIDYTELSQLLSEGEWEEANELTYELIINIVGKNQGGRLTSQDLINFPSKVLQTIDQQWLKHSNGRFGFSVQREIYLSIGGKPDSKFREKVWKKFGDLVGWRDSDGDYFIDGCYGEEYTFDISAPKGHLPVLTKHYSEGFVIIIFSRLEA